MALKRGERGDSRLLVECPACNEDLRHSDRAKHLLYDHGPEDFGLSPTNRSFGSSLGDRPVYVVSKYGDKANTAHLFSDCNRLKLADTVLAASGGSLSGREHHCAVCVDREEGRR